MHLSYTHTVKPHTTVTNGQPVFFNVVKQYVARDNFLVEFYFERKIFNNTKTTKDCL